MRIVRPLAGGLPAMILILGLALAPARGEVNRKAIEDVAAGKIKEARASWWGYNPEDSTQALQAAINSGVPKLVVDNVGQPWVVEPIRLAGNQEILFERGVEVLAKKGAFKGTTDVLFSARLMENITLRGYGATLRMRRDDYAGPAYARAEWRHCLAFYSCKDVKILGLTVAESGGDGIYLGNGKAGVSNKNFLIKDVVCDKNYRQGISVITAEDLLIEECVLKDTAGTAPMAGIDFEPNGPDERLVNIVMRNCLTERNAGGGYLLALGPNTTPISMRFENCRSVDDVQCGAYISIPNSLEKGLQGEFVFEKCTFERSKGPGLMISSKPVGGARMRFDKCAVLDPAAEKPQTAPLFLMAARDSTHPVGDILFNDLVLRDMVERKPLAFVDMSGDVGLKSLTGRLLLEGKAGRSEAVLTDKVVADWTPRSATKRIPRLRLVVLALRPVCTPAAGAASVARFARVRQSGRFVLHAKQGEEVTLRVGYQPVARYSGRTMPIVVTAPSGKEAARVDAAFEHETDVRFTAPETGVYRVKADPGLNTLQLVAGSHPVLLNGEDEPIHLFASAGDLYIWVPDGTKEFGVRVSGEGIGEAIKATLLDAAGQVFGEVDNATAIHQFEVNLAQPSAGEAWCLRLSRPTKATMEDHYVDLRGIPPLLAAAREGLLAP